MVCSRLFWASFVHLRTNEFYIFLALLRTAEDQRSNVGEYCQMRSSLSFFVSPFTRLHANGPSSHSVGRFSVQSSGGPWKPDGLDIDTSTLVDAHLRQRRQRRVGHAPSLARPEPTALLVRAHVCDVTSLVPQMVPMADASEYGRMWCRR
jgi:hypothetical protein